ncbi:phytoene/squalene synthase family protein [Halapricum desulfuricans]|uniref:Phytoene/squalene synthetase n=1 Tax=Halapricum desulfuricans TaxID=2841257 RepID=A0A897N0K2_9EURY|nr:phytoene/squalene synthase family protein [Halapricum desulfuricans]QSG06214.1 Phytoene/squalene synthetase [Halapricum desulfuricans]
MLDDNITTSKEIHRQTGKTFYYATRLLPERIRKPTYVLYGFFRIADEVVDQADSLPPEAQYERLESFRAKALGEEPADDDVLSAFQSLREQTPIRDADVNAFIDAMEQDIERDRYETYEDLEAYMRGSAVAVGNMMLDVMDPEQKETARPHAASLAEAFQLSNFLRDVGEDISEYGRIYLPLETLEQFGACEDDIVKRRATESLKAAMRAEMARTDRLYRDGVAGIQYLPDDCQFAVLLAAVLYADHHRKIRQVDFNTIDRDANLGRARKLYLIAKTWWHWRKHRDPETTFYAVSAVPEDASTRGPRPESVTENMVSATHD